MQQVFVRPTERFLGDVIPYSENGKFYLFFLSDPRRTEQIADETSWDLLVTTDFLSYDYYEQVLEAGTRDEADNCCYTGSVFKAGEGDYHLFYTAHNNHNERYQINGRPIQTVMHATSCDLIHWIKHEQRFGADVSRFEPYDWRDPFVYLDETGVYRMLLAARSLNGSFRKGGIVLQCSSHDLWQWTADEPFYAPNAYLAHECPELFQLGDWWYLVYSTFTEKFATHYRMSRSPQGPWIAPQIDTWDARAFYAAKTAGDSHKRFAFGWIPTKRGENDRGRYDWGGNLCVHELVQQADGTLLVRLPQSIERAYSKPLKPRFVKGEGNVKVLENEMILEAIDKPASAVFEELPVQGMIEADISWNSQVRSFGMMLHLSDDHDNGYFFRFEPFHNRLVLDMWPRHSISDRCDQQHYLGGDIPFQVELERPIKLENEGSVHVKLLFEDSIAVCYANNTTALSTRLYNLLANRKWGFFAQDGRVRVSNIQMRTLALEPTNEKS